LLDSDDSEEHGKRAETKARHHHRAQDGVSCGSGGGKSDIDKTTG